jgi:hypothetical protein
VPRLFMNSFVGRGFQPRHKKCVWQVSLSAGFSPSLYSAEGILPACPDKGRECIRGGLLL